MALSTVATCRAIFETTLQYAKDREQFGRPIGSFQALKHRLADCYLAVERAASLAYFAALTIAEDDDRRAVATAMAKAAAGDCQRLLTRDGLQLHGGIGFTWEHDLHLAPEAGASPAASCSAPPPPTAPTSPSSSGWRRHEAALRRLGRGVPRRAARVAGRQPAVARGDGRRPVRVHRPRAGVGPPLDPHHVRRRLAGPGLAAGAGRPQRRPDRDARLHRGAGQGQGARAPPTCRASGSSPRRSSTTAPTTRSATTPCRSSGARSPPASG